MDIERWVPYTVLVDIKELFKHAYIIVGRRHAVSLSALNQAPLDVIGMLQGARP